MEQTRDTYRGGGVIPAVIPWLLTSSKYSRAPTKTAAAKATVKTQPPANTMPPTEIPMPSPNTILFFSWLALCWCSETGLPSIKLLFPWTPSYKIHMWYQWSCQIINDTWRICTSTQNKLYVFLHQKIKTRLHRYSLNP